MSKIQLVKNIYLLHNEQHLLACPSRNKISAISAGFDVFKKPIAYTWGIEFRNLQPQNEQTTYKFIKIYDMGMSEKLEGTFICNRKCQSIRLQQPIAELSIISEARVKTLSFINSHLIKCNIEYSAVPCVIQYIFSGTQSWAYQTTMEQWGKTINSLHISVAEISLITKFISDPFCVLLLSSGFCIWLVLSIRGVYYFIDCLHVTNFVQSLSDLLSTAEKNHVKAIIQSAIKKQYISISMHPLLWMSWLISFVWASPSCED